MYMKYDTDICLLDADTTIANYFLKMVNRILLKFLKLFNSDLISNEDFNYHINYNFYFASLFQ